MKKNQTKNHSNLNAKWRFYAVIFFLLAFLISTAIFSSTPNKYPSFKSKAQISCDCPWPGIKKADGSCEYGFYDTGQINPYFVGKGHNTELCSSCYPISYKTPNPEGGYGICRFSNANVCVREDGIGGCGGICNWECCVGKPSKDPANFEKKLKIENLCQAPNTEKKSCPGFNIQRGPCQNVVSPGSCAFRGESWEDRNWYNQWVYCCENGDWYAKSEKAQGNPQLGWQSKEECEKEGSSSQTSSPQSNCFEKPTNYGSCIPFSKIGECHQRILPGDPDHLKWFRCGEDGLWKGPCESKEECEGKTSNSSSQLKESTPLTKPPTEKTLPESPTYQTGTIQGKVSIENLNQNQNFSFKIEACPNLPSVTSNECGSITINTANCSLINNNKKVCNYLIPLQPLGERKVKMIVLDKNIRFNFKKNDFSCNKNQGYQENECLIELTKEKPNAIQDFSIIIENQSPESTSFKRFLVYDLRRPKAGVRWLGCAHCPLYDVCEEGTIDACFDNKFVDCKKASSTLTLIAEGLAVNWYRCVVNYEISSNELDQYKYPKYLKGVKQAVDISSFEIIEESIEK